MCVAEYDISDIKNNRIEFLFDYTNFISKNNLYDSKTFYWQIENAALLKQMGVNMEIIKEVNFLIQKAKDRNSKYYKYDNFINQIDCIIFII